MKQKHISFFAVLVIVGLCRLPADAQETLTKRLKETEQLKNYLQAKNYFKLRSSYNELKKDLSYKDRLYFKAFIDNIFNRCDLSDTGIQKIFTSYRRQLNDSTVVDLLTLKIDNQVKTFHYRLAAQTSDILTNKYKNAIDTAKIADIKNSNIIWHALAGVPPQQISRLADTKLSWKRDIAGLMTIPVYVNGQESDFVFDTGANFSTISKSYAKKFNFQIIETSFNLGSSTSITSKATLAIAKQLRIGNIEFRNIVFLVLPDEQLIFPQAHYTINAIIGFPAIAQMGEVHIKKGGTMNIPRVPKIKQLYNLALDGLQPILALKTGNDTLAYRFDTGAKQTELFSLYFDKYKNDLTQTAKIDSANRGGVGGSVKVKVYKLPYFDAYLGNSKAHLANVDVLTTPFNTEKEYYYGNIGQDFIALFDEIIINFDQMYIDLR